MGHSQGQQEKTLPAAIPPTPTQSAGTFPLHDITYWLGPHRLRHVGAPPVAVHPEQLAESSETHSWVTPGDEAAPNPSSQEKP
jgi:hypothetical protein